jgi:predicted RNase H-like nuclease (RuvC/YqgF family)
MTEKFPTPEGNEAQNGALKIESESEKIETSQEQKEKLTQEFKDLNERLERLSIILNFMSNLMMKANDEKNKKVSDWLTRESIKLQEEVFDPLEKEWREKRNALISMGINLDQL